MSKFIVVGNTSLIKENITKYITEDVKNPEIPFWITIYTSDSKSTHSIHFKTKEERDKAFKKFIEELGEN